VATKEGAMKKKKRLFSIPTDAENLHERLSNYNSRFFTYLSVSAVGLALGGKAEQASNGQEK
jgi:hypothetical protein